MIDRNEFGRSDDPVQAELEKFRIAWFAGEDPDPEVFCRSHPEGGEELREKIESFLLVATALPEDADEGRDQPLEAEMEQGYCERKLGDFSLIREIGRGGMGVVYEADQISLNRRVALKVLSEHLSFSSDAVMKFRREAEAGGRQRHPGIVAIYAVGELEGTHYIAQELVCGGHTLSNLLEKLRREEDLPLGYFRQTGELIAQVADALENAHSGGVIHRDVKPSNILLDPAGSPKVTDFGLAKIEDALALSRTGDFAGTPYYMSPEQALSRRIGIDRRTDIYSLGVTLYEALTLKVPFEGETTHEILKRIILQDPSDPRKINPRVPHDLAVICLKAMEKDANHRYQSMADFAGDLRRFFHGEVIQAKPAGFPRKIWKRCKRNPTLSAAIGVSLAAILALILSIPWYVVQITKQKNAAMKEAERNRAISEFMNEVFQSPIPVRRGKDVTVVKVLEWAIDEIDRKAFQDYPETEAKICSAFGTVYYYLGRYDITECQFQKALEIQSRFLGEEDPSTLKTMNNLACVYRELGALAKAERLFREVLEKRRRVLGEDSAETALSMSNLASVLLKTGRIDEAESLLTKALDFQVSELETDLENDYTAASRERLGDLFVKKGELSRAESLYLQILDNRLRQQQRVYAIESLSVKNRLALIYLRQGRTAKAEDLLREAVETARSELPAESIERHETLITYGRSLIKLKKFEDAETHLREGWSGLQFVLGDKREQKKEALSLLTALYEDWGKPEMAAEHRALLEKELKEEADQQSKEGATRHAEK